MDIVAVGHSHLRAIRDACVYKNVIGIKNHNFDTMMLSYKFWDSMFEDTFIDDTHVSAAEKRAAHEELLMSLEGKEAVVFSLFGNRHNKISLLNLPQPVDFIFDETDEMQTSETLTYVPRKIMKYRMEKETKPIFMGLKRLLEIISDKRIKAFCLESPPPIPSEHHIRSHPEGFDLGMIDSLGISPIGFRKKMWKLHSELVEEYCNQLGITFVPVPQAALDSEGCLIEAAWFYDPSHANAFYGKLVLEDLFGNYLTDVPR